MNFAFLHDRLELESFLRRNTFLNIYAIGDLDDFFWPCTCWFGHRSEGEIDSVYCYLTTVLKPPLRALMKWNPTEDSIEWLY